MSSRQFTPRQAPGAKMQKVYDTIPGGDYEGTTIRPQGIKLGHAIGIVPNDQWPYVERTTVVEQALRPGQLHFVEYDNNLWTGCGRSVSKLHVTVNVRLVTCKQCLRSRQYKRTEEQL